jgi:hypothetical protein
MLLQTNSYLVPPDRRAEHARLVHRFRQVMRRLGCLSFEVYEQTGPDWAPMRDASRFVQIMRFRDRRHQLLVQAAERADPAARALIDEFCAVVDLASQQERGSYTASYYRAMGPVGDDGPPGAPSDPPAGERHDTEAAP